MVVRLFGKVGAEVPDLLLEVAKGDYFLENSQAKLECIRKRMEVLGGMTHLISLDQREDFRKFLAGTYIFPCVRTICSSRWHN